MKLSSIAYESTLVYDLCAFASMSVLWVISNLKCKHHLLKKHQSTHHHMQCMCDVCQHCALVPFADREHGNAAERNAPEGGAAGSRLHQTDGGLIVAWNHRSTCIGDCNGGGEAERKDEVEPEAGDSVYWPIAHTIRSSHLCIRLAVDMHLPLHDK